MGERSLSGESKKMSHALRRIEVYAGGTWNRMPMSCYGFTPLERKRLDRGKVVEKWGFKFRLFKPANKPSHARNKKPRGR